MNAIVRTWIEQLQLKGVEIDKCLCDGRPH